MISYRQRLFKQDQDILSIKQRQINCTTLKIRTFVYGKALLRERKGKPQHWKIFLISIIDKESRT